MNNLKKEEEYARKISLAMIEIFNEDSECYIGDDFYEEENRTHLIHAILNIVPTTMFNKIVETDGIKNMIDVNHIANKILFRYMHLED